MLELLKQQLKEAEERRKQAEELLAVASGMFAKAIDLLSGEEVGEDEITKAKQMEGKAVAQRNLANVALSAAVADITRFEAEITEKSKAVMPASMPGAAAAAAGGTLITAPEGDGVAVPTEAEMEAAAMAATYTLRFGEAGKAAKAVLVGLYGNDYEQMRQDQWAAFHRYIRHVNVIPSIEDERLLKSIILTPDYASDVANSGIDLKNIKATMVEAIDILGGYAVPVDFQDEVLKRISATAIMRRLARQMSTSRDRVEIVKFTGGDTQYTTAVRVTWVDETPVAGTAETNLTLGLEGIDVHNVMAECPLSRNTVEDNAVNLVSELIEAFAEAQIIDEDNQFVAGDGLGKPQGIIIGGLTPATGVTSVPSLDATDLTPDGIIDIVYSIASQYRKQGVFIMERDTLKRIRKFKDADGNYMWERSLQVDEPDTLLGRPIHESESMASIAAGAFPIAFGDPQGYRIVDRIGMTVERFLDSSTARTNTVLYLMRRRLGGQLLQPERWAAQEVSLT